MTTTPPTAVARPAGRPAPALPRVARVWPGLLTAAVSMVAVWALWRVFVDTAAGRRVELAALIGAQYGQNRLWDVAGPILDVVSVTFVAVGIAAAMLVAVVRRRWLLALQVAVLVAGANLTTQVLKEALPGPRGDIGGYPSDNTLPSGHTTVAASVAAAIVFVVPPRGRPWAALFGATYTAATGVATLIGQWHRPSDVLAAVLVVLAWSGLACAMAAAGPLHERPGRDGTPTAAVRRLRADGRPLPHAAERLTTAVAALLGVGAVAAGIPAVLALARSWSEPGELDGPRDQITAYAGGCFAVLAVTALAFAVMLLVRRAATAEPRAARPGRTALDAGS